MTINYCPGCGSYSGNTIEVLNKAVWPEDEELLCNKCGWVGTWDDMIKLENGDHLVVKEYRTT